nr:hypothetical protein [Tanacetum cinerariifolium]
DKIILPLSIQQLFVSASFSPSAGEVVALSAKGTPLVVALDAFSTRVANLFKDERLETVEVKVSSFDGISFRSPAFYSSSLISERMIGSFVEELGVKKADLISFKISAKSYSFTFHEMSLAPDSSFTFEVVWAVFNSSPADLVLSTRTLRLDPARSALAVKSAKASCPDADSECKMKEVDQAGFLPWGTSSVGEEYLGALESTGTSRLWMAFMWSVKGGKKGFGLSGLSRVIGSSLGVMSGDDDSAIFE